MPGIHGDDLVVKSGEAPFVLGDQNRLKAACTVARHVNTHGAAVGQDGLAAGAVALVGLAVWLVLARLVAQVMAHLHVHRPLNDGLLERQKQVLDLAWGHRPLHQLLNQLSRHLPQRATGCRLRGYGSLLGWHIHDLPSCYAAHTKSRIGSAIVDTKTVPTGKDYCNDYWTYACLGARHLFHANLVERLQPRTVPLLRNVSLTATTAPLTHFGTLIGTFTRFSTAEPLARTHT
jgi:hypothetical protein